MSEGFFQPIFGQIFFNFSLWNNTFYQFYLATHSGDLHIHQKIAKNGETYSDIIRRNFAIDIYNKSFYYQPVNDLT